MKRRGGRAVAGPPEGGGLRLSEQLCFALYAASRRMTQAYQPYLSEMGLTYPQYLVLLVLWEEDGVTVTALGQRLQLDSGTMTPLLKRMEAAGLLRRARDATDERVRRIQLTPAGRGLRLQATAMRRALQRRYADRLAQAAELRDALHRLSDGLK